MLKRFRVWLGFVAPSPARGLVFSVGLGAALLSVSVVLAATTKQDALALLASAVDADELTRATIARYIGDETLLSVLHQPDNVAARLAAVRCSAHLRDPDRALADLSAIARGRDPDLAPAAALRLRQIAQALLQRAASPEIDLDIVRATRLAMLALAEDRSAIAAIRTAAGQTSYLLGTLLAQLGEGL
ncbi:MAG TPA: hypothetical protein VFN67_04400 [Polyangiales bacterium]|nr:hypothetical protein [Polyangiales bacterium]